MLRILIPIVEDLRIPRNGTDDALTSRYSKENVTKWWCPVDLLARPAPPPIYQHSIKWTWTVLLLMSDSENPQDSNASMNQKKTVPQTQDAVDWSGIFKREASTSSLAPKQFDFAMVSSQKAPFNWTVIKNLYDPYCSVWIITWNTMDPNAHHLTGMAHLPAMGPVTSATIGTPTFRLGQEATTLGRKKQSWNWWSSFISSTLEMLWCHLQPYLKLK